MCAEVAGRSEMLELGGEGGNAFSFELNAIVKSVSFCDKKFLRSEMILENGCKIIVSFLRGSFWWAQVRKDVVSFGTDDRYQGCSAFESFACTVCCPVSGQKKLNSVIFDGILTLRPPKRSLRKTNIFAINWWFWWGFWSRNERTRTDFVQVSKILPANFWPFHCTVKLPYVKK